MAKEHGSVRIGPVSIFALIIILCLAVLAMLSITTANAGWALAQRQASFTADLYENEQEGQQFLADVDAELAAVRSGNASLKQALGRLEANGVATTSGERSLVAQFRTSKGHELRVELDVNDDGTYQITKWLTTTVSSDEADTLKLWSGDASM